MISRSMNISSVAVFRFITPVDGRMNFLEFKAETSDEDSLKSYVYKVDGDGKLTI